MKISPLPDEPVADTKKEKRMTSRFQKFTLLVHITFSAGWFGAVVPYLALAIAALASRDEQTVRAAILSMKTIGWFVIVPFSFVALLSGLIQSLGTRWGLFRHWWIVAKLVLTIFAVAVLLQHMREVSRVSAMAKDTVLSRADLQPELLHSAGGLLVLFAAMTLSVFKPWGMTSYGRRKVLQVDQTPTPTEPARAGVRVSFHGHQIPWTHIVGYHALGLFLLLIVLHVAGLHHH